MLSSSTITNFNPGDVLVVKAKVQNHGSKSAHIRGQITFTAGSTLLTTTLPSPSTQSVISVYSGALTLDDINATTPPTAITLDENSSATLATSVIDGSEEFEQNRTSANKIDTYDAAFTIYFNKAAGNTAQGKSLGATFKVQAIQYRNNSSPTWTDVVADPFTFN